MLSQHFAAFGSVLYVLRIHSGGPSLFKVICTMQERKIDIVQKSKLKNLSSLPRTSCEIRRIKKFYNRFPN